MMDRNSIIGLVLIFLILIGYTYWTQPSQAEIDAQKRYKDSVELVKSNKNQELNAQQLINQRIQDSIQQAQLKDTNLLIQKYGGFGSMAIGVLQNYTLENNLVKIDFSNKGAQVSKVKLKEFKRADSSDLILFDKSEQSLDFTDNKGQLLSTNEFYWSALNASKNEITFRLSYSANQYIEYVYFLKDNSYNVSKKVKMVGLNSVIKSNQPINLKWKIDVPLQEYEVEKENTLTTAYYKPLDEKRDFISETKFKEMVSENPLEWVSFKQQFFNSSLYCKENFEKGSKIESKAPEIEGNVKNLSANLILKYQGETEKIWDMTYFFGPNKYYLLKDQEIPNLDRIIPLGVSIFGAINRFAIIPLFSFLTKYFSNLGLVIVLLTLIIKTILLPLVWSSFKSTAKMRILKPEMDAIKEKHKDNMQQQQMENLAMYKKAGVNPLGGCIPMLLQMPILIAVFQFVPSAFEFRQQAFWWATDLSHYDSIFNFSKLPIIYTIYGSHVSLFTILMTISTLIYTYMNNQVTGGMNEQMKYISYIMPIMFLGFFNKFAAALSFYYFVSNCVTFTQQWAIKNLINEDKLKQQINDRKNNSTEDTKSNFQKRLEEMAKAKGVINNKKK